MSYIEDRVESLEYGVFKLLAKLMDYKCPSCGNTGIFASWGDQSELICMGKGCGNSYSMGQIADTIVSINKPIVFHPKKVY